MSAPSARGGAPASLGLGSADAQYQGENADDYLGYTPDAIAGAGDVNGDGYDDVLLGAYLRAADGTAAAPSRCGS